MQDPINRVTLESHFLHQNGEDLAMYRQVVIRDVFACNYNVMDCIRVICIFIGLFIAFIITHSGANLFDK